MSDLPSEVRLSLDWELWVVEQLLFEARLDDLIAELASRGLPMEVARERVAAIEASDGFRRLRARAGEATLAARLQRLQREILVDVVAERPTIDADTLLHEHWIPSRPLKLTRGLPGLHAFSWTPASLTARFGDVPVFANIERTSASSSSTTERVLAPLLLRELLDRVLGPPSNELYAVSRCGLLAEPGLRPMWEDLGPLPSFLGALDPPRGVSMWVGPEGTVTPAHFDPHNALLVQVMGTKRIRLAPRLRAAMHGSLDGYYLRGSLDEVFGDRVVTVQIGPGEALFVPVGWFHEVTALSPSITLSFVSFPWPNHFHFLGPPGSDDRRG
jgi:hypothetical protein